MIKWAWSDAARPLKAPLFSHAVITRQGSTIQLRRMKAEFHALVVALEIAETMCAIVTNSVKTMARLTLKHAHANASRTRMARIVSLKRAIRQIRRMDAGEVIKIIAIIQIQLRTALICVAFAIMFRKIILLNYNFIYFRIHT